MHRYAAIRLALAMAVMSIAGLSGTALAADASLVVRDDFENGAGRWQPMDANSWKILSTPRGNVYSLFKNSDYKPPYRSPVNIALLKDVVVGDFVLEIDLQSTVKDYDHRSMVLVFGYQDPAHFYYVHFGKKTDNHANQVFIVNGDARTKISTETTAGTHWDDAWHKVKIDRDVSNGDTEIFFDNMKRPVMEAVDDTFTWGQIGIGAFDDLGNFDNLTLRGKPAKAPAR